jgi:RNA polymerase, sigma subunit, RpsC/SigC
MSNYEPELNDILLDGPADLLDAAEEAEVDLADGEFLEEEPTRRSTDLVRLYYRRLVVFLCWGAMKRWPWPKKSKTT